MLKWLFVISDNYKSKALARAISYGIHVHTLHYVPHHNLGDIDKTMTQILVDYDVDYVILAGYMKKIGGHVLTHFHKKVLNIHPSLLPKFGGYGMYGDRVHKAVLESGDDITGATVHIVTSEYDKGPEILKIKTKVFSNDTIETLSKRVREHEHFLYPFVLQNIIKGCIDLDTLYSQWLLD